MVPTDKTGNLKRKKGPRVTNTTNSQDGSVIVKYVRETSGSSSEESYLSRPETGINFKPLSEIYFPNFFFLIGRKRLHLA